MAIPMNEPSQGSTAITEPTIRQCPTLAGDLRSLITHQIVVPLCQKRQREHYHKCHRCEYRGQSADYVVEQHPPLGAVAETGLPKGTVELPHLEIVTDGPDREPAPAQQRL